MENREKSSEDISSCTHAKKSGPKKDEIFKSDKKDPLLKHPVQDNKINVYQSSSDGLRFAFSQIDFNEEIESGSQWFDLNTKATLIIDLNKTKQTIDGFGGAFTDSACENIMKLPIDLRQEILDSYFDQKNGLEYSLGRTTIGGSDFSSRIYTLDDIEDDYDLKNFSLSDEDINYKIPIIKMALKHLPELKIISTSWSPPVWLKSNKKINHRGHIIGEVTEKAYQTYANYFVKYLDAYKEQGINIYGISPANEPTNGRLIPFFPFNCVGFSARQMKNFIALTLGPTLKNAGYGIENLKLFIVDDQRYHLRSWVKEIMNSNASQFVTGVAFHWYGNFITSPKILDEIKAKHPQLDIWSTEACSGSYSLIHKHVEIGSWSRAEEYSKDISSDFNHQTSAWIDWNLALDTEGGPNWSSNFVDAPIIVDLDSKTYIRQPMFYALAHFSKFIKPGSINIQEDLHIYNKLFTCGFYTATFKTPNDEIVVVVTNTCNKNIKLSILMSDNKSKNINFNVIKRSITTFVWKI